MAENFYKLLENWKIHQFFANLYEITFVRICFLTPLKPADWDTEAVRNEVIQIALSERRNPTEEIKTAILDIDGCSLTPTEQIPDNSDRTKMETIQKNKYFAKIFYNNVVVTQSTPLNLGDQLTVHDGSQYKIRTREKPKSARIEIYEVTGRFKVQKQIGGNVLDIPSSRV